MLEKCKIRDGIKVMIDIILFVLIGFCEIEKGGNVGKCNTSVQNQVWS